MINAQKEIHAGLILCIQDLLSDAKAGKIDALAWIGQKKDGTVFTSCHGDRNPLVSMNGGVLNVEMPVKALELRN